MFEALLAPFVDEARAADRRRRLEFLQLAEMARRTHALVLQELVPGFDAMEAEKRARWAWSASCESAERQLEQEALGRG